MTSEPHPRLDEKGRREKTWRLRNAQSGGFVRTLSLDSDCHTPLTATATATAMNDRKRAFEGTDAISNKKLKRSVVFWLSFYAI